MTAERDELAPEERDPLALAMFAAWVNVPVDKLPPEMRGHTCPVTMVAWGRVADAARAHLGTPPAVAVPENGPLPCAECGRPVLTEAIVDADVWREISPTGDEGGYLCAACMADHIGGTFHWAAIRMTDAHAAVPETPVQPQQGALMEAAVRRRAIEEAAGACDIQRAHYEALIAKGKGSHGDARYVRDQIWDSWHGRRCEAEWLAGRIRALAASEPAPGSQQPPLSLEDAVKQARREALEDAVELTRRQHGRFPSSVAAAALGAVEVELRALLSGPRGGGHDG